ncbi:Alcohol dehydrogenase GroES-like domain-containing protein 14 [Elsinoe fawcettii]|nr:Alcohol dehydrogenase GroES-like domain-containing protein 14 [Elsinoe fawcettii]
MPGFTALRLYGRKQIQLDTVEPIPCGKDEVRLKIGYCGICGSDIHEFLGAPIFSPAPGGVNEFTKIGLPVTMGHEFSGTVVEVGSGVTDLKAGQKVCVNPSMNDNHHGFESCSRCVGGKPNLCKRWATYGLNASGGGFANEIVVRASNCFPLPDEVSLKVGALAEPLAVAWHCIRVSGFQAGQTALILGAGPIGLAILLLLRVWDAKSILITEVTEQRTLQAKAFGADMVINPLQKLMNGKADGSEVDPVMAAVKETTADGIDVAFDCTGLQSTLDTGLAAVRPGGTFFNVAIHEKPLLLNPNDVSFLEKKILGGLCYTDEDFRHVIDAMAAGKIPFEQMITSVVPLSKAVDGGFNELLNNKAQHVKILIQPDS